MLSPQMPSATDPSIEAMAAAERELAMYAAIIGHRPTVETVTTNDESTHTPPAAAPAENDPEPHPTISLHAFHLDSAELKHRVTDWVKQMSQQAKRRIDEAKMRLAG